MVVSIMKAVTSAAVGGLDIGLEMWDEQDGRVKPFERATDYGRIAAVGGGLAMDFFAPRMGVGEAMFYSGVPLLEKSIKNLIMSTTSSAGLGASKGRGLRLNAVNLGTGRNPIAVAGTSQSKRGVL